MFEFLSAVEYTRMLGFSRARNSFNNIRNSYIICVAAQGNFIMPRLDECFLRATRRDAPRRLEQIQTFSSRRSLERVKWHGFRNTAPAVRRDQGPSFRAPTFP